jgi:hypothetical protein
MMWSRLFIMTIGETCDRHRGQLAERPGLTHEQTLSKGYPGSPYGPPRRTLPVPVAPTVLPPPCMRVGVSCTKANQPEQHHHANPLGRCRVLPEPTANRQSYNGYRKHVPVRHHTALPFEFLSSAREHRSNGACRVRLAVRRGLVSDGSK